MTYNAVRLVWAVPGAIISAVVAYLLGFTWWGALALAAAMGAFAAFVIAGIAQECLRRKGDDRANRA